jgi:phosphatidylserine decarboxylase
LFARTERLICLFDTAYGPMALVLVGAMIVAGIETVWDGQIAPPLTNAAPSRKDFSAAPIQLEKAAEMGRFKLGSTAILLFGRDVIQWQAALAAGTPVRMGQKLAEQI